MGVLIKVPFIVLQRVMCAKCGKMFYKRRDNPYYRCKQCIVDLDRLDDTILTW